jgi:hypothetical protein
VLNGWLQGRFSCGHVFLHVGSDVTGKMNHQQVVGIGIDYALYVYVWLLLLLAGIK